MHIYVDLQGGNFWLFRIRFIGAYNVELQLGVCTRTGISSLLLAAEGKRQILNFIWSLGNRN